MAHTGRIVTADDGLSEITVPSTWTSATGRWRQGGAAIHAGNAFSEEFVLVITSGRADFEDFAAYHRAMVDSIEMEPDSAKVGKQRKVTVGGLPAIRYRFPGTFNKMKIYYWSMFVHGKKGYYQVVCWTTPLRKTAAAPVIDAVMKSFREVKGRA